MNSFVVAYVGGIFGAVLRCTPPALESSRRGPHTRRHHCMYLSSRRTDELWPDTRQGALRAIAIAAVFLALAATLLYVLSPGLDTWPRLLVFHESVGLTMVACMLLLRHIHAFARFASMTRWLLTGVIAIPTGFVVGHQLAYMLLGEPLRMVGYVSVSQAAPRRRSRRAWVRAAGRCSTGTGPVHRG